MAEITRKRVGELQRGVLTILRSAPNGLPARELLHKLAQTVVPTPFEAEDYPNRPGVRRYEKIVRFSTIAPVKAGWLAKTKGTWQISPAGAKALDQFRDPEAFQHEARRLYRAWSATQPDDAEDSEVELQEAISEKADAKVGALEEAEELAWADIEEHLLSMPPYDFQEMVAALLRAMGYHVAWVAPPGRDGGLDIVAQTDPLGAKGPRIKVQVKRRKDKVDSDSLSAFLSKLGTHDIGLYVALGGFTSQAELDSRQDQTRRVTLIDAEKLVDLWIEHSGSIAEVDQKWLPLKPIYYLAPA